VAKREFDVTAYDGSCAGVRFVSSSCLASGQASEQEFTCHILTRCAHPLAASPIPITDIASSQPCATCAQARDKMVSGSWASGTSQLHDHPGETPISRAPERRSIPSRQLVISVLLNTGGAVMAVHQYLGMRCCGT
jgi:hypothetical protein